MDNPNTPPPQPDGPPIIRSWGPNAAPADTDQPERDGSGFLETSLVLSEDTVDSYRDDPSRLTVERYDTYDRRRVPEDVSATLVGDIVSNDRYYEHLLRMIRTRAIDSFRVNHLINGDLAGGMSITFANVAEALKQLADAGAFEGNEAVAQRVAEVAQLTSGEQMRLDYQGTTYRATIDGENCAIPTDKLVGLLLADEADYQQFLENGGEFGLPKETVAYALVEFANGNNLFTRYAVPDAMFNRYRALASYEQIDFEAVGKLVATGENEPARQAVMNDELHAAILKGMPAGLSDLERATYVYIKMCRLLSYDAEYYAVDSKGPATLKFQEIARISTITPENNQVVCFEFNALFEKMLDELGIHYETKYGSANKPDQWLLDAGDYGAGHEYCQCRIGNFIVAFDSVTGLLGDLSSAKFEQKPRGIICRNQNQHTRQEFQEAVVRAYQHAVQPEGQGQSPLPGDRAFRQAAATYHEIARAADSPTASFEDRLARWIGALSQQHLDPMDAISYAVQLRRAGFTEDQKHDNFSLTVVRENQRGGAPAAPTMVLAVNPRGFSSPDSASSYFTLSPQGEVTPVSLDELRRRFGDKQYEYLEGEHTIPGVALPEEQNA